MTQDITNKKFTITLPQLIGIISLLSTLIGFYYYAKTTIQTLQVSVDISNTSYKDVKGEVKLLREQLYDIAFLYNKNEHENEHKQNEGGQIERRNRTKSRIVRDTINLSLLRMRK